MSIPQTGGGPIESRDQLAGYLEAGCKPKADWRIGTEHEKFGYRLRDRAPLRYEGPDGVRAVLEGLRDRFGWKPLLEGDTLIGLKKADANISLEPGGQLELSGAPLRSIHQTCEEVNQHLAEVRCIAQEIGVGFIGLGAAPEWRHEDMERMPKGRYALMADYMPKVGGHGLQMMFRTCTVQVNLDFGSEADMARKMRVALSLQPVAVALFANSPLFHGQDTGWASWRARVWHDVDQARSGMLPFVFEQGFGFERYVDYALDVPMYFVYRDGRYVDAMGQSFRDFLDGRLPALPGEKPTLSDWADHLTTIFPEARLKRFIEMRGADGGPWRRLCALPALWVGLMYDEDALVAADDLVAGWSHETRTRLRMDAARLGLAAETPLGPMRELARQVIAISDAGLKARAEAFGFDGDERHFLNALHDVVERGETMADEIRALFHGAWRGAASPIYDAYSY